jgi:homoserine dehydrogenase
MRLIFVGFGTVGRGAAECLLAARAQLAASGLAPRLVAVIDPAVGSALCADGLDEAELLRLADAGIRAIRGVLNGTCNFILTQMEQGVDYTDALVDAQQKGYAEADPSGDVDGWDAAAKALILANCVLGAELGIDDVQRTGIAGLSRADIETATAEGNTWRLVARIEAEDASYRAAVAPELVRRTDPLGALTGPRNLLAFDTESLGEVVISGPGAGRRATGHAIVADLLALHRRGAV